MPVAREIRFNRARHALHGGQTCEQHKRAAIRLTHMAQNSICKRGLKVLIGWIGHGCVNDELHLARKIKGTSKLHGLGVVAPQAPRRQREIIQACRQCGAGQHHGNIFREQLLAQ